MKIMNTLSETGHEICREYKKRNNIKDKSLIKTSKELPGFVSIEIHHPQKGQISASFMCYSKAQKDRSLYINKLGEVLAIMPSGYMFKMPEQERALFTVKYDIICVGKFEFFVRPICAETLGETEDGLTTPLENTPAVMDDILSCFKESNTMDDIFLSAKTGAKYSTISQYVKDYVELAAELSQLSVHPNYTELVSMNTILNAIIEPICNQLMLLTGKTCKQIKVNKSNENVEIVTLMLTNPEDTTIIGISLLLDKHDMKIYKATGLKDDAERILLSDNIIDIIPMFGSIQKKSA